MSTETLCWRCSRPGTGSCSWDKKLQPVDGWTAERQRHRDQHGFYSESYRVISCPLFDEEPDYQHRMTHIMMGKPGPKPKGDRERIVHLIRNGFRNEAIALEFGIAVETVKKYRTEWNKLREAER